MVLTDFKTPLPTKEHTCPTCKGDDLLEHFATIKEYRNLTTEVYRCKHCGYKKFVVNSGNNSAYSK